jgi:3-dehydroquinate dehydratase-1
MHRLLMMEHFGASIAKIAMMPNEKKDVLNILNVTMKAEDVIAIPVVTMSMGQLGMASRLVGQLTGSVMTFGTAGHASAPGQVPVSQLREILELLAKK